MKTLDRAVVFKWELALASSVIFFGYATAILPICSPKQVFVREEFQLGDLAASFKMWERKGGRGKGFPYLPQTRMLRGHLAMNRDQGGRSCAFATKGSNAPLTPYLSRGI